MYAQHLVTTMGTNLNDMVFYTSSGNGNNIATISKDLFLDDWFCVDNPYRIRDNYDNETYGVVMGISSNKSVTTSFSPYCVVTTKLDISSFQAKNNTDIFLRNEPFSATVLNAFNNININGYYQILKFTTIFAEGDSISFYFLCFKDLPIDSTPYYFYAPNGSDEYSNGYNAGYNAGYDLGNTQGYDSGYNEGYDLGESNGYQNGYNDGVNTNNSGAYQEGYNRGYINGKQDGYNLGVESAHQYTFTNLISAVIDVPINTFTSLFNFEILGVNLSGFFLGLLTCCVVIAIVKLLI
jgi:hypothetical protein